MSDPSARSGLEGRYTNRFARFNAPTSETIHARDDAQSLPSQLSLARGVIQGQEKSIQQLMSTAEEMIRGIDTFQHNSGRKQVRNMPAPTSDIKESAGKQLGYIQLSMRFLQSGLLHFMEEMLSAQDRLDSLEKFIKELSSAKMDIPLIGELQQLDLDALEGNSPISETRPSDEPLFSGSSDASETSESTKSSSNAVPKLAQPIPKVKSPAKPTAKPTKK